MRKAAVLFGVALFLGVGLSAKAQQPFEDVPRDHWAYQAVQRLQERGVVIGYPDGTFGGKRAMTRYEFAVAIDRLLVDIIDKINRGPAGTSGITQDQLNSALEPYAKKSDIPDVSGYANKSDIPDVSNLVTKDEISNFVTKEDLANVQKLVDEFKDELAALGTDVQNLRRDLDALKARVSAIEDRLNRWRMSGEANAIVRGERFGERTVGGIRTRPGTDLDSRIDLNNAGGSVLENSKFLYDLNLGITGRPVKGVQANALFNYGNYLRWVSTGRTVPNAGRIPGNPGDPMNFGNFGSDAMNNNAAEFTPLKLNIEGKLGNLGPLKELAGTLGKFGNQFTPYTLKQVDPDSYTYVSYTDNGEVLMTGAKLSARVGKLMLTGYAAKHDTANQGYGYMLGITASNPLFNTPIGSVDGVMWDQSTGARGTYDFGRFRLGATYVEGGIAPGTTWALAGLPAGSTAPEARRGQVFGADLSFDVFHNLKLDAEFASSNTLGNFTDAAGARHEREGIYPLDRRNAWDGKLSYGLGRLSLAAGYRQVDPYFGAPGFWGAIGRWKNPTNIKGFNAAVGYALGEKLSLEGQAEFYNSLVVDTLGTNGSHGVQHFQAGLKYNLTSANRVDLGWEQARYRPLNSGVSIENYYNIGFGHSFNDSTSLKLLYQIVDYSTGAGATPYLGVPAYKGGIAVGQLSVKF